MAFAHNAITELHGFEHVLIYGVVVIVLTVAIKVIKT